MTERRQTLGALRGDLRAEADAADAIHRAVEVPFLGMSRPYKAGNPQFVLNTLHWLVGSLRDR